MSGKSGKNNRKTLEKVEKVPKTEETRKVPGKLGENPEKFFFFLKFPQLLSPREISFQGLYLELSRLSGRTSFNVIHVDQRLSHLYSFNRGFDKICLKSVVWPVYRFSPKIFLK